MSDGGSRAPILPTTKVAALLESWPELEEVLIAQAPAFRRLRKPVLRRTVARVATLEQAAGVGGVPVRDLVSALRRAAGLADDFPAEVEAETGVAGEPPSWLGVARVVVTTDADAELAAGQVPLATVNEKAHALQAGEALRVVSAFRPAPLIEALAKQGFESFCRETSPGHFETFVAAHASQG